MKDRDRDALRKCVLDLICKGYVNYTRIEKKAIASCAPYITSNTFKAQFYGYLLANGYVAKTERGKYTLTLRGQKLLELLTQ
jgi:predicted transcriptional regulator